MLSLRVSLGQGPVSDSFGGVEDDIFVEKGLTPMLDRSADDLQWLLGKSH